MVRQRETAGAKLFANKGVAKLDENEHGSVDISMNTHLKTIYILPDSLNLETLLVEETPRVKPKKAVAVLSSARNFQVDLWAVGEAGVVDVDVAVGVSAVVGWSDHCKQIFCEWKSSSVTRSECR
ncbi:Small nuclear ribonucleoprotein SmD1a [Bienertia sinuspersici]